MNRDQTDSLFRLPATSGSSRYLLGQTLLLLLVGMLLDVVLFKGTEVGFLIRMLTIVPLLLTVLLSWGWILLLAVQVSLFFREPPDATYGVGSVFPCLVLLALVVYAHCSRADRRSLIDWMLEQISLNNVEFDRRGRPGDHPSWKQRLSPAMPLVVVAITVPVAILLLTCLPITLDARRKWLQHSIAHEETFWPGADVLALAIFVAVVGREFVWRQMTAAQAKLYGRSTLMVAHHRDLSMVVKRWLKSQRRRSSPESGSRQLDVNRLDDTRH